MSTTGYVHGYSPREAARLRDQADTLSGLLHEGVAYGPGRRVLEVGCGTGAQTVFLAAGSPQARITSVDLSAESVARARSRVEAAGLTNVTFQVGDLFALPFADGSFDDLFLCFVLEHLVDPAKALATVARVLKPGGTLSVIEGDHGSWYCHPETREARRAVECLIEIQARLGGDSLVGRRLHPLMQAAGYADVAVTPRMVYVDDSRPDLVEGFSRNTFIAMVQGVREQALALGLMEAPAWDKAMTDLLRAAEPGGTFCYTFFRATGKKP